MSHGYKCKFFGDYHPLKPEPYRVIFTVEGDILEYPDDVSSPAASLSE